MQRKTGASPLFKKVLQLHETGIQRRINLQVYRALSILNFLRSRRDGRCGSWRRSPIRVVESFAGIKRETLAVFSMPVESTNCTLYVGFIPNTAPYKLPKVPRLLRLLKLVRQVIAVCRRDIQKVNQQFVCIGCPSIAVTSMPLFIMESLRFRFCVTMAVSFHILNPNRNDRFWSLFCDRAKAFEEPEAEVCPQRNLATA